MKTAVTLMTVLGPFIQREFILRRQEDSHQITIHTFHEIFSRDEASIFPFSLNLQLHSTIVGDDANLLILKHRTRFLDKTSIHGRRQHDNCIFVLAPEVTQMDVI